jgi:hypothetical protein
MSDTAKNKSEVPQFHGHLLGHYVPFWVSVELGVAHSDPIYPPRYAPHTRRDQRRVSGSAGRAATPLNCEPRIASRS